MDCHRILWQIYGIFSNNFLNYFGPWAIKLLLIHKDNRSHDKDGQKNRVEVMRCTTPGDAAHNLIYVIVYPIHVITLLLRRAGQGGQGWQFVFACQVRVVSTHTYLTIWVNTNPACLLNGSRFLNPNMTHLLNGSIVSTCLSDFIKMKKNIYEKTSK